MPDNEVPPVNETVGVAISSDQMIELEWEMSPNRSNCGHRMHIKHIIIRSFSSELRYKNRIKIRFLLEILIIKILWGASIRRRLITSSLPSTLDGHVH